MESKYILRLYTTLGHFAEVQSLDKSAPKFEHQCYTIELVTEMLTLFAKTCFFFRPFEVLNKRVVD